MGQTSKWKGEKNKPQNVKVVGSATSSEGSIL